MVTTTWQSRLRSIINARAALAGAVASAAYAAEMYADIAITGSDFDDVQLVESSLRGHKSRVPWLGMTIHLANGAALGIVYHSGIQRFLRGPSWLRGLQFGLIFLAAVWPSVPLVDRVHPLIKRGDMPKLAAPVPFAQNVARHLVFGLVLGLLAPPAEHQGERLPKLFRKLWHKVTDAGSLRLHI